MTTKIKNNLQLTVISALFAALSTVFVYFIHFPNAIGGYIHVGDAIVYLCASLLPTPYAAVASAVGFGLADLISGYPYYILPSAIIRVIVVLFFTSKKDKIICKRNLLALPCSAVATILLYAVTKYVIYSFIYKTPEVALTNAIASMAGNFIQCAASCVLFIFAALALDKLNFKSRLKLTQLC